MTGLWVEVKYKLGVGAYVEYGGEPTGIPPLTLALRPLPASGRIGVYIDSVMAESETDPPEESLEHLRARAEAGDSEAQCNLGVAYADGRDVPEDPAEAVRWYRLSAD